MSDERSGRLVNWSSLICRGNGFFWKIREYDSYNKQWITFDYCTLLSVTHFRNRNRLCFVCFWNSSFRFRKTLHYTWSVTSYYGNYQQSYCYTKTFLTYFFKVLFEVFQELSDIRRKQREPIWYKHKHNFPHRVWRKTNAFIFAHNCSITTFNLTFVIVCNFSLVDMFC